MAVHHAGGCGRLVAAVDWVAAPANVTLLQQPLFVQGMPRPLCL